jgi:glycosyltransferase involved in cell wall biosynthesis
MSRPRGILVADVPGWAFDQNNDDAIEYCSDYFDLSKFYMVDLNSLPNRWDCDFIFCPWHRALGHFKNRTKLGSLRSQWFDTSRPAPPAHGDIDLVNRCAGFHVVTRGVYDSLKEHCPGVVYLTNPVNTRRFPRATAVDKEIVCCWNGNAQHSSAGNGTDAKGFYSIVVPACSNAGVKLAMAEYHTNKLRPHQMPRFYQRANVALCASAFEGASNSVMEAMASGLAVIVTDVGNHREMHESMLRHHGDSGMLIIGRDVNSFAEAISSLTPKRALEMGAINRQEIQERWSWDAWRDRYLDFYSMAVRK